MSYNILKKNVRFSGGDDGTIEGIVDISGSQQIVGDKTFTSTITSSADVMVSGSGKISASFFYGDGSTLSGLPSGIGGSNTQVQFNDDGVHGGSAYFTFATGSSTLSVNTGSVEVLSASNYISASTYYGDGSNLTNLGEAGSIAAANIVGSVIATQVSHSSPLTASGGNLTVRLNSSRGIVDDAGLALDIGQFGSITNFSDTHVILVSGSAISNKKMTIGTLQSNLSVNLTNSVGTLPNGQLPAAINVTTLSASLFVSASSFANAGGTLITADGDFQGNNASFNEITASGHVSASTYYGDGSNLTNIPAGSPAGANTQIQLNADGAFGASSKFTFSTSSATLEIAKSTTTSNEAKIWFHSGSNVFGDGSGSYIESDGDDHFVFDNNTTDAHFKFITRANGGDITEKITKLTIFGNLPAKGVALGNPTGIGGNDTVYVGNLTSSGDTIVRFRNINNNDVSLIMTGSTFGTTLTSERLSGDFTIGHDGGNVIFSSSVGPFAQFDSGNSYLFKTRKLHYKEITFQLASSLTGGDVVWLPMGGTLNDIASQQYYTKFIAPFDGEIVKVMMRADLAAGLSDYTLAFYKSSNGTEHPTTSVESGSINLDGIANTTRTLNFSSATFSSGDVLGFELTLPGTWSPASSIGVNATIVIAYDELS